MLFKDFKNFYQPYFYDQTLDVIPVTSATIEQANSCEFISEFDHSQVSDLPLKELVEKHIIELPKGFTFISAGQDADPTDKYLRPIISKLRPDIKYIKPDREIDLDFVEKSASKYFSNHPFLTHTLATVERLIKEDIPCGRFGPFIRGSKILDKWLIQEIYDTIPMYMIGNQYADMVVPNFVLPFSRAFIKNINLPECRYKTNQIGPVVLMMALLDDVSIATQPLTDGDDWNWYPQLVNRNWQRPTYYQLEGFIC